MYEFVRKEEDMLLGKKEKEGEKYGQNDRLNGLEEERFAALGYTNEENGQAELVQRKIGLEFQTYRGTWNIKKLKDKKDQEEVEQKMDCGEETFDEKLSSQNRVTLDRNETMRYEISADGPDLEYITDAFDEEKESIYLWMAACFAGLFHQSLPGKIPSFARREIGAYYMVEHGEDIYYINKKGEQTAHPQATVGVEYEKIPDLMERIAKANKGDILYQDVLTAGISRGQLQESQEQIKSYISEAANVQNKERSMAFLELAEEYLRAANDRRKKVIDSQENATNAMNGFIDAVNGKAEEVECMEPFIADSSSIESNFPVFSDWVNKLCEYERIFMGSEENYAKIFEEFDDFQMSFNDLRQKESKLRTDVQTLYKIKSDLNKQQPKNKKEEAEIQMLQEKAARIKDKLNIRSYKLQEEAERCIRCWEQLCAKGNSLFQRIRKQAVSCHIYSEVVNRSPDTTEEIHGYHIYLLSNFQRLNKYAEKKNFLRQCSEIEANYLSMCQNKPIGLEHYFKTLLSVKTRTSLYDLYQRLPEADRKVVFDYLDSHYTSDMLIWEDRDGSVTYGEWKEQIQKVKGGTDLISYELEDGRPIRGGYDYQSAYGVERSTDIGHDRISIASDGSQSREQIDGALLELRKLQDHIPPDKWGDVADQIVSIIHKIHHPEDK